MASVMYFIGGICTGVTACDREWGQFYRKNAYVLFERSLWKSGNCLLVHQYLQLKIMM